MYALFAENISTTHKYDSETTDFLATELIVISLLFEEPTGSKDRNGGGQFAILMLKNLHFPGSRYEEPKLIYKSSDQIWCTMSSIKSLSTYFLPPPKEKK